MMCEHEPLIARRWFLQQCGVGLGAAMVFERYSGGEMMSGKGPVLVPGVAVFMLVIGLIAAAGPARRGLSVQPTEALKS